MHPTTDFSGAQQTPLNSKILDLWVLGRLLGPCTPQQMLVPQMDSQWTWRWREPSSRAPRGPPVALGGPGRRDAAHGLGGRRVVRLATGAGCTGRLGLGGGEETKGARQGKGAIFTIGLAFHHRTSP